MRVGVRVTSYQPRTQTVARIPSAFPGEGSGTEGYIQFPILSHAGHQAVSPDWDRPPPTNTTKRRQTQPNPTRQDWETTQKVMGHGPVAIFLVGAERGPWHGTDRSAQFQELRERVHLCCHLPWHNCFCLLFGLGSGEGHHRPPPLCTQGAGLVVKSTSSAAGASAGGPLSRDAGKHPKVT